MAYFRSIKESGGRKYTFRYSGKDSLQTDSDRNPIVLNTLNELDFLDNIFSYNDGIFTALVDTTFYYCLKIRSWRPDDRYADVAICKNGTDVGYTKTSEGNYTNYIIGSMDVLAGDKIKIRYPRRMYGYASLSMSDNEDGLDTTIYTYGT